ncbi:MAG: hypothetical protein JSV01_10170 [Desulfobacterales bacterium]|nr:MAG: hypothetical protein JSV01_10170 [Desulfobacterales bacterium]
MWCDECQKEHTLQEFCSCCGTCLLGEYGYPHDTKNYSIRISMCLICNALNTIEYDIVEPPHEKGPPTVEELEKTFDELWGTEDEGEEVFDINILGAENSIRNL